MKNIFQDIQDRYTNYRLNKLKKLEIGLNKEFNTIKSDNNSPKIVEAQKEISITSLPTAVSIGRNIEYSFKSLRKNPIKPETIITRDLLKEFENYAQSIGITSIGYTKVPSNLIFKDRSILFENAIILTKEIDEYSVNNDISNKASRDLKLYDEFGKNTNELTDYLRQNGFNAQASHPAGGMVTYPSLAQEANLGWVGKSHLLITPELGPSQKISAIFTSIENLPQTGPNEHSWISDYCANCGKCVRKCPVNAILEKKSSDSGLSTKIKADICKGCNEACTICMKECPFNKKDYAKIKNRFEKRINPN